MGAYNHRLDVAEQLVNRKIDVKKLSTMQHREADLGTIIKRFRNMEDKVKRFNMHLIQKERENE